MVFSFITGYYNRKSEKEMRIHKTALHYIKTWFLFDCVVVIPMWLLLFADTNLGFAKNMKVIKFLRMARVIRLLRLAKFNNYMQEALAMVRSQAVLVMIG